MVPKIKSYVNIWQTVDSHELVLGSQVCPVQPSLRQFME